MKATQFVATRVAYSATAFAEIVLWQLASPLSGSSHSFKYRLAYVVSGAYVLRYDNEVGEGDPRHFGEVECRYEFATPDRLIADFQADIARWNRENSNA